jgi:myo-inositol catabolism protein IolC
MLQGTIAQEEAVSLMARKFRQFVNVFEERARAAA